VVDFSRLKILLFKMNWKHIKAKIRKLACTLLPAVLMTSQSGVAQSTALEVYKVFQNNCTSSPCHDSDLPAIGLDLQGSGPDAALEVYNNIVNVTPVNAHAADAGYSYIVPGSPERSFIFRKAHNGLDPTIELHPDEGGVMPLSGNPLTEYEAEIIRQWILFGARPEGEFIDTQTIVDFYENGVESIPNPPVGPAEGEGFQMHLGPFFIPPGGEDEVFIKFDPQLEEDTEVSAVEVFMGNQSHHFILYKFFDENGEICGLPTGGISADDFPDGFRDIDLASHSSANFQIGAQNTERTELPYNTALFWDSGSVLDLNSHYINDNQNSVLGAEVYVNIYTQPSGTAAQEMESIMIPNLDIDLPNTGEEITLSQSLPVAFCFPQGMYIWATTCHTHKYGKDYDIYVTDLADNVIDHIYDASCFADGVPGCPTEFYDYQHPPTRVFEDYYRLTNLQKIRHDAVYVNDGPEDVGWGFTSEDEMMLYFFFYVQDTAGLSMPPNAAPVAVDDMSSTMQDESVSIPVLDNDIDPEGRLDASSVTVVSMPSNGTATVNPDGSITYEPGNGFSGMDTFLYAVCDSGSPPLCDTAEVVIEISMAPTAVFGNEIATIKAYPNPTTGILYIEDPDAFIRKLNLFTIHGRKIVELSAGPGGGPVRLDLGDYGIAEGTYMLIAEGGDGSRGIARLVFSTAR
jgi:hypothetical protein